MNRRVAAVLLLPLFLTACETYLRERADVTRGQGQSYRLLEAKERLDNARTTKVSLEEERLMAEEELDALETELAAVNENRAIQEDLLARAREATRISQAQEDRLLEQLNRQTEAYNDTTLELDSARIGGSEEEVQEKAAELGRLKEELDKTNREIDVLTR
ncbi:MAG: hypothetical protein ACFB6S_13430 [Geminicoccaceae bacterium]